MRSLILMLLLITLPISAQATLLCENIFSDEPQADASTLLPQFFGINKNVEDLVLSGPFQDSALELTELFTQINDPLFIIKLSHAFQYSEHDAHPEINHSTNWYAWKAKLTLQYPHLVLHPTDWVRLWNIYNVLQQQFSTSWSPSQIAWMSSWLLKIVSPEHFILNTTSSPITHSGPLRALQDPLLHQVYETLLSDNLFKELVLKIIKESNRYSPNLRQQLLKPKIILTTSLESQILVNLTFQILYAHLKLALEEHDWDTETRSGLFIPDNINLYLEDLFVSHKNQELALHLLKNIFMGIPIPIIESEFQALLLASLKQQMRPIIDEALNRGSLPPMTPVSLPTITISALPLPLTDYINGIVEQQTYTFTIARNRNLGTQTLKFAPDSLDVFKTENLESPAKFMRALQNGFTDENGDNGLKKLSVNDFYEIRPGRSTYRMVIHRSGNIWTVIKTLHKDTNVNKFVENLTMNVRSHSRGGH